MPFLIPPDARQTDTAGFLDGPLLRCGDLEARGKNTIGFYGLVMRKARPVEYQIAVVISSSYEGKTHLPVIQKIDDIALQENWALDQMSGGVISALRKTFLPKSRNVDGHLPNQEHIDILHVRRGRDIFPQEFLRLILRTRQQQGKRHHFEPGISPRMQIDDFQDLKNRQHLLQGGLLQQCFDLRDNSSHKSACFSQQLFIIINFMSGNEDCFQDITIKEQADAHFGY